MVRSAKGTKPFFLYTRRLPAHHGIYFLSKGRSYRAIFSKIFLSFLPRKTGKAEKTGSIFSKVWKFNRGQNVWKASHSNIWKKKKEKKGKHGNTKTCAKKKTGNLDIKSFYKNGPKPFFSTRRHPAHHGI